MNTLMTVGNVDFNISSQNSGTGGLLYSLIICSCQVAPQLQYSFGFNKYIGQEQIPHFAVTNNNVVVTIDKMTVSDVLRLEKSKQ